jgi:hypothetical protein
VHEIVTLVIPKKDAKKDLILLIKGVGPVSDPDLYISTTNQEPTTAAESSYFCDS